MSKKLSLGDAAQIGNLLGEIEQHHQAVVCDTCTKTIKANSDGFGYTVHYRDSDPINGTIECYECCPLSPASRKFLIEDAWTEEEDKGNCKEEEGYSSDEYGLDDPYYDPDYDHGFNCPCGSVDCRQFMQTTTGRNYKVYPEE